MPTLVEEPKPKTTTAKVFYRLRDLFIRKGSVYTAQSAKLGPMLLAGLLAVALTGGILYRLSEPVGKSTRSAPTLPVTTPEPPKGRLEPKPEESRAWPSTEDLLRRLTGQAPPAPVDRTASGTPPSTDTLPMDRGPVGTCGPSPGGVSTSGPAAERPRGDEPLESSKVFERPAAEAKSNPAPPEYEYVSQIAAVTSEGQGKALTSQQSNKNEGKASVGKPSLFTEVRARLLMRIDTSLPGSPVLAEVTRDGTVGSFSIRRGSMLMGKVSAASANRVSVTFDRLVDPAHREHAIEAQAVDLAGAQGLAAKSSDSKLKKGLLYANDRALDYVRALKGHVAVYSNPAQGDLRALEQKALIVEPSTEFTVIFHRLPEVPSHE